MKKLICLVLLLGGQAGAGYIPDMPYFHQYSNRLNPSGSCQNTCIAIVLKYYGADDITPDKISAKWGTYIAQTTGGLEKIFNAEAALRGLPVRDLAANAGTLRELHGLLDAGRPVIVHGGFSEVGHLMVLVGYDERYYYAMDPASKWTERVNGGFTNRDDPQIGRYTRYRREAVEAAIIFSASRNQIRMHQIYFEHGALADSVALGESVAIAGGVRLDSGRVAGVRVVADLRELGGGGRIGAQRIRSGLLSAGKVATSRRCQRPPHGVIPHKRGRAGDGLATVSGDIAAPEPGRLRWRLRRGMAVGFQCQCRGRGCG